MPLQIQISVSPKCAVPQAIGCKRRDCDPFVRVYGEKKRHFVGQHFRARGHFVPARGRDETMIREYLRHQELEDQQIEQMSL